MQTATNNATLTDDAQLHENHPSQSLLCQLPCPRGPHPRARCVPHSSQSRSFFWAPQAGEMTFLHFSFISFFFSYFLYTHFSRMWRV